MTKVLVIEDEQDIREEVIAWLQFEGYDVVGAADGMQGLDAIARERPDLVLCDIAMPRKDGHDVLIEVRANPAFDYMPFIFVTAAVDHDSVRMGMNLGADDYLTKPFSRAELMTAVQSRLKKKAKQEAQLQLQMERVNQAVNAAHEQRMLKTRLVSMFSHDFRNPLASILSSSSILRNYEARMTPDRKLEHLDRIESAVHLLTQMIDDMLTVAELESGHLKCVPEPLDLGAFLHTLVEDFRLIDQNLHSITYQNGLQTIIEADPKLLRQIVANLLSNAIKYSPSGTEIAVSVTQLTSHIRLMVQDHGIGIPQDSLPRLFEPFFRADNAKDVKGTGLGLSIIKDCVECHQGQIYVESQINTGTTFIVEIPLTSVPA